MITNHTIEMMKHAIKCGNKSRCTRQQVGAVIATEERVLTDGYNGTVDGLPSTCEDLVIYCVKCGKEHVCNPHAGYNDDHILGCWKIDDGLERYGYECTKCHKINAHCRSVLKSHGKLVTNKFTLHAEQKAIAYAATKGIPLEGSTMYATLSPCHECAKLIVHSGIKKVVYLEEYRDTSGIDFLKKVGIVVEKIRPAAKGKII